MLTEITSTRRGTRQLHCLVCILNMRENQEVQMLQQPNPSGWKSTRRPPHGRDEPQITRLQRWQLRDVVSAPMRRGTQNQQPGPPRDCSIDEIHTRSNLRWRNRACTRTNEVENS